MPVILLSALLACRHEACRPVERGDLREALQATLDACWIEGGAPGAALAVIALVDGD